MDRSKTHLAAILAACMSLGAGAALPDAKPLRIIVPAAAGGPTDAVARVLAPALAESLGGAVVVENRGGAGGIVGTEAVARSARDGSTVALVFIGHATNPALRAKLPYDTLADFTPIGLVGRQPLLLVVNPDVRADSPQRLATLAKSQPPMHYAADTASASHLAAELFKHVAGAPFAQVPYRGNGPALTDVVGGQVPFMFSTVNTALPLVRAGKLRALAVTSVTRSRLAPEVATMAEAGFPDVEVSAWYGFVGPAGMPQEAQARLNAALAAALRSPAVREAFAAQGIEVAGGSAVEFDSFLRAEIRRWSAIIREAHISAD